MRKTTLAVRIPQILATPIVVFALQIGIGGMAQAAPPKVHDTVPTVQLTTTTPPKVRYSVTPAAVGPQTASADKPAYVKEANKACKGYSLKWNFALRENADYFGGDDSKVHGYLRIYKSKGDAWCAVNTASARNARKYLPRSVQIRNGAGKRISQDNASLKKKYKMYAGPVKAKKSQVPTRIMAKTITRTKDGITYYAEAQVWLTAADRASAPNVRYSLAPAAAMTSSKVSYSDRVPAANVRSANKGCSGYTYKGSRNMRVHGSARIYSVVRYYWNSKGKVCAVSVASNRTDGQLLSRNILIFPKHGTKATDSDPGKYRHYSGPIVQSKAKSHGEHWIVAYVTLKGGAKAKTSFTLAS